MEKNVYDEPCWVKNVKGGHKVCIPRRQLIDHKKKLDDNGDPLFVECEPEFVPKKHLKTIDDEKKQQAQKYANTDKTYPQVEEILKLKMDDLKEFAKKQGVSLQGLRSKKLILEKLEHEGKLY